LHWQSAFPFLAHLPSPSISSKRNASSLFRKVIIRQSVVDRWFVTARHRTDELLSIDVTKWFIP
jgi:hypothetical protein